MEFEVAPPLPRPAATGGQRIATNVAWNWAGLMVEVAVGFFLAPYLVHRLGDTTYGLWIIVGSLTSYFGLLDLGVRGSVGQYVAVFRARGDVDGLRRTFTTATLILSAAALMTAIATLVLVRLLVQIVEVPPVLVPEVRLALLIVGLNLALSLVLNICDAVLWGLQRFDLLNAIDMPAVLLRAALTVAVIEAGHSLSALAWVTLVVTIAAGALKFAATLAVLREIPFRLSTATPAMGRTLFVYGSWNTVRNVAQITRRTVSPVIIGSVLGVGVVTPFSVAVRLINYAVMVLWSGTNVLTPVAAGLHARARHERQRELMIEGGTCCFTLALCIAVLFITLGPLLIRLWMGAAQLAAAPLLAVLIIGELLPMSQLITEGLLLGSARHRPLAVLGGVEVVSGCAAAVLLMPGFGLLGAGIAFAVAASGCRGVGTLVIGCRALGVPVRTYLRRAIVPALLPVGVPALLLVSGVQMFPPSGWLGLFVYGSTFGAMILASASWWIPGEWRTRVGEELGRRFARLTP